MNNSLVVNFRGRKVEIEYECGVAANQYQEIQHEICWRFVDAEPEDPPLSRKEEFYLANVVGAHAIENSLH